MARDGQHFFYVNPLEVWPEASRRNPGKHHVKPVRQGWFACACCPPNVARLLASLGEYVYTQTADTLYTHLYIGGTAEVRLAGSNVTVTQESGLPWSGQVAIRLETKSPAVFTLALRIPDWTDGFRLTVNGVPANPSDSFLRDGYVHLARAWQSGDRVQLELPMDIRLVRAHPQVRANAGKVALVRGPLVYALEGIDHEGGPLAALVLDKSIPLAARFDPELLGGAVVIEGGALREQEDGWEDVLYSTASKSAVPVPLRAIPYYLWGNRGEGEMTVWFRER
jgi:hypothetical protein